MRIQSILSPGGKGRKRKSYETLLLPRLPLWDIDKESTGDGETDKVACGDACLLVVASGVLLLALALLLLLLWRE